MSQRTRSALSWVLFVLGSVACVAIAYAAYTLAGYSWDQVVSYRSPYVTPLAGASTEVSSNVGYVPPILSAKTPAPGAALTTQTVLVIVDGMRDDISRSAMPALDTLRDYGSDMVLTAPQPALSYPNWTTILTGAPQTISGVTTNWWEGPVAPPTIMKMAASTRTSVAVVGPEDFEELYGVKRGPLVSLRPWPKGGYLSSTLIDDALRISKESTPALLVIHLPDLDEAGHEHGGDSEEYREVAKKIDADLGRLISGLQGDSTTFIITSDHGHIGSGGHGGWEDAVVAVPAVITGNAVAMGTGTGTLEQIAPTVAVFAGIPVPTYATGTALRTVFTTSAPGAFAAQAEQHRRMAARQAEVITDEAPGAPIWLKELGKRDADAALASLTEARLTAERAVRLPTSLLIVGAVFALFVAVGVASWRALVSASAGVVVYYALYNGLFFWVHGYLWSLSAFNTETQVSAFMNGRMAEAIVAALVGAATAAALYPFLRRAPRASNERRHLSGWLALATATVLLIQATLAVQVAWYLWWWGATITWILPDFKWAFKADLDMVQMTALGAAAVLAPAVTYVIGRVHPRVRAGRTNG